MMLTKKKREVDVLAVGPIEWLATLLHIFSTPVQRGTVKLLLFLNQLFI